MLRLFKHIVLVVLFVVVAGCSGGGCARGCSCGGVTPLPAGFPTEKRIENAASVRLTDSGLTFLEQNLGAIAGLLLGDMGMGGLTFEVPPSSGSQFGIQFDVCPDGPNPMANPPECVVEVDLANAQLNIDSTSPHNIHITGPLPVRLQNLPVHIVYFFIPSNINAVLNGNDTCPGESQTFANVDLDVDVSIEIDIDMAHSRYGYSRVRIGNVGIDQNDLEQNLHFCGGFDAGLLNSLKSIILPLLIDPLIGSLQGSLEEQLCQQANPNLTPPCPDGTTDDGGVCRYADGSCASIILGIEGNIDLGGLLASFSPGTTGGFDFLFAAGGHSTRDDGSGYHYGDLNPIGGGATLGLYGGAEPVPLSGCVTPVAIEPPQGIPIPDELTANTVAGWPMGTPGPHVNLAISERFTNYLLAQLYNSGALCLGITADALGDSVPLTTALVGVGLGARSMEELGHLKQAAPIAILLRPQAPPQATFGNGTDLATDPLIRINLPRLSFDFYVWSVDRYIRMLTATMDLDIPVNLMVAPEGLVPVVESLTVSNAEVTNSQLLREDPQQIAAALEALLGDLVGGFLGDAFPPLNLNDALASLGLTLDIPPSVEGMGSPGLRKLEKGRDRFLAIFGTIGIAPQMMMSQPAPTPPMSDTTAELVDLQFDPANLGVAGYRPDNGPKARIYVGSSLDSGAQAVEWQYKLDKGPWHPFTRERWIDVDDDWLRVEGRHLVKVRSRVVGQTHSLDSEPAEVPVIVDGAPPWIDVRQNSDGRVKIAASDAVSGPSRTRVRMRLGQGKDPAWGTWSEWLEADDLSLLELDADAIQVEAEDEGGRVTSVTQPLLRGRGSGDGCNCNVPGSSSQPRAGWLLLAGLVLAFMRRRRPRDPRPHARGASHASASHASASHASAGAPLVACALVLASGMSGCSCGEDDVVDTGTCRGRGDCEVVLPGLVGAYTSTALASDGTLWVAGYLEASHDQEFLYGDLAVGRWNGSEVEWKAIDGVPSEPAVDPNRFDPQGFRGGQTEPGDDVGLWTSIAIGTDGHPAVAYYDVGNRALRYAKFNGESWDAGEVQRIELGDAGRYAKLVFVGGQPIIAYQFIEPGAGGAMKSGVRLARGGSGWAFEDVAVNDATPCRYHLCGPGTACVADTGLCTQKSNDCAMRCADTEECVDVEGMPGCVAAFGVGKTDTYPDASGLYISAVPRPNGELGIAFYDRVKGNMMVAVQASGAWSAAIADGETDGTDTGDKGIGASLAIDAQDNFHLSYVDGLSEALVYLMLPAGAPGGTSEIVDDGLSAGDGPHLVGDDSHIVVNGSGEVRISYQDATTGQLRLAVGTPSGASHAWVAKSLEQEGFGGFFSRQIEVGGSPKILNWWRVATPAAQGNVRLLDP